MKKIIFLIGILMLAGCKPVTNFEECVAAGNPVMESYPRQCRATGQTFVEIIPLDKEDQKIIGGEKDEYGCLIPAGYQWCPSKQKCMRMWEEYCEEYKEQYKGETET